MKHYVKNHPTPAVGRHVKFVQFVIIMNDAWTQLTQTLWMSTLFWLNIKCNLMNVL